MILTLTQLPIYITLHIHAAPSGFAKKPCLCENGGLWSWSLAFFATCPFARAVKQRAKCMMLAYVSLLAYLAPYRPYRQYIGCSCCATAHPLYFSYCNAALRVLLMLSRLFSGLPVRGVHSALRSARATCGAYMHLESIYRNPIHRSNQHSEVVMHTSLTLHICICNDRRCERDMCTLYSDFRLQCQCILLWEARSTEHQPVKQLLLRGGVDCAFAHLTALQARLLHLLVIESIQMDTMDISFPNHLQPYAAWDLKRLYLEGDIVCVLPRRIILLVRQNTAESQITS